MESIGDPEHISRNKEKYVLLEEKTKELGYKVGMLSSIPLSLRPRCSAYPWVLDKEDLLTQGNTQMQSIATMSGRVLSMGDAGTASRHRACRQHVRSDVHTCRHVRCTCL